jgi:hypothetical protein
MSHRPAPTRDVLKNAPQRKPSCDDVLYHPSERKDSSDRPSQRENHDWEHDEDQYPESRQHVSAGQSLAAQSYQRKYTLVSLEQDRARLLMQAKMLFTGVVFALGMVIAGVSVTHEATAAEATEEVTKPQPLINRYEPPPSEAEPRISDREQLKRYFLQGERGWPRR